MMMIMPTMTTTIIVTAHQPITLLNHLCHPIRVITPPGNGEHQAAACRELHVFGNIREDQRHPPVHIEHQGSLVCPQYSSLVGMRFGLHGSSPVCLSPRGRFCLQPWLSPSSFWRAFQPCFYH